MRVSVDGLVEMIRTKLTVAVAAMLVLTAFASVPVAAQESSVSVETEAPTNVTTDSATLNGDLTSMENASEATVWFEYWEDGDEANSTETENLTASDVGLFSIDVDDLESNTTYVVVARADADGATGVGTEVTFTTDAEEAVAVTTEDASAVTDSTATLNGELTELRGAESATVWFEYWEQGDRANNSTTPDVELDEPGAFSASIDGLANNTTYVVVAQAATENVSDVGDQIEFTTGDRFAPLDVETHDATGVTNTSATLNGELTGLSGEVEADVWFEYWVEGNAANSSTTPNETLSAPGSFSEPISGLENDTTYVYVAHATSNNSTVTGEPIEFTTGEGATHRTTWDGEGPFGQWLTSVLKNLVPPDSDVPLGQIVSDIVTSNNPGNGQGPPEHAGPPNHAGPDGGDDRGPPPWAGDDDDDDDEDD